MKADAIDAAQFHRSNLGVVFLIANGSNITEPNTWPPDSPNLDQVDYSTVGKSYSNWFIARNSRSRAPGGSAT